MMRVDNGMPLPMQQGPPSHDHPNFRGPRAPDYDEGVEDGVPNVEYHSHRFASHTGSSDVDENEEETDDDDSTKGNILKPTLILTIFYICILEL